MEKQMLIIGVGEVREASDKRKFYALSLSPGLGLKPISRNMWEQFIQDSEGNNLEDEAGNPLTKWERLSPEDAKAAYASKQSVQASKVTRNVIPYSIGEGDNARTASTYSAVVFSDENEGTVFRSNDHLIVDENGVVTNEAPSAGQTAIGNVATVSEPSFSNQDA